MGTRNVVPADVETEILIASGRRCCLCFGLNGNLSVQKGQISHLDHDSSHSDLDNLAFLCLQHHEEYDSVSRQAKGLTPREAKHYRALLYSVIAEMRKEELSRKGALFEIKDLRQAAISSKTYAPLHVGKDTASSRGVIVTHFGMRYRLTEYTYGTDVLTDGFQSDNSEFSGLTWGYSGSGPHNTAFSILRDLFGREIAMNYYISFCHAFIRNLPKNAGWVLTSEQIIQWLETAPTDAEVKANWFENPAK